MLLISRYTRVLPIPISMREIYQLECTAPSQVPFGRKTHSESCQQSGPTWAQFRLPQTPVTATFGRRMDGLSRPRVLVFRTQEADTNEGEEKKAEEDKSEDVVSRVVRRNV